MFHSSRGRWTAALFLVGIMCLGWMTVGALSGWFSPDSQTSSAGQAESDSASVLDSSGESARSAKAKPDNPAAVGSDSGTDRTDDLAPDQAEAGQSADVGASYDFAQPAPEREAVDNSYFEDAAFVGDSRTDGFLIYSGIGRGKNLTSNGLSIFKLREKKALTIGGTKYTLLEALALEQYGKVYLSLGVNELGYYDDEGFYRSYCQAIDDIRALQPNAVIYIQGLIPLNEKVILQTGGRTYLTNEHLRVYNDLMRKAAEEKQVVFLDLYSEFVNENGELPAQASKDGVHLRSDWCKQWLTYLQTHTVDFETLYPNGVPQAAEKDGAENGSVVS